MRDITNMDAETSVFEHIEDIIILIAIIAVIFLKLLGVINLSWFWILSPFWICAGLFVIFIVIAIISGIVSLIIENIKEKRK